MNKEPKTVLMADDDEMVLNIGKKMLERMGFNVLTAKDGPEAINVYKNNRDIIDFIISDTMMPGDGEESLKEIKKINPDVKIIITSGDVSKKPGILKLNIDGFIQKPYSFKDLSEMISEVLQ
jgi:CheY-like chemotaxis protein